MKRTTAFRRAPVDSKQYREWKRTAGWALRIALIREAVKSFSGDVAVAIKFHQGRGDVDNRQKPLLDLLQDHRIVANDSQVKKLSAEFGAAKGWCVVTIEALRI